MSTSINNAAIQPAEVKPDPNAALLEALSRDGIFDPRFRALLRLHGCLPIDLAGLSDERKLDLARAISNTIVMPGF
jgi:hypothetical protein